MKKFSKFFRFFVFSFCFHNIYMCIYVWINFASLPVLDLEEVTNKEGFATYHQELRECVSEDELIDNRWQRVLKHRTWTRENKIQFPPITYFGLKTEAVIYAPDLYIIGIKRDLVCYVLYGDLKKIEIDEINKSLLNYHGLEVILYL